VKKDDTTTKIDVPKNSLKVGQTLAAVVIGVAAVGGSVGVLLHATAISALLTVIAWLLLGIYLRLGDIRESLADIDSRTEHHLPTAQEQEFLTGPGTPFPDDCCALWRRV